MDQTITVMVEDRRIKLVWLRCFRGEAVVLGTAVEELPESLAEKRWVDAVGELGGFLRKWMQKKQIAVRRMVFCLPSRYVLTRELTFPKMKEEQLRMALRLNAADYFPTDLSDCALALGISGREKERLFLTVAAVPDALVCACTAAGKAAGCGKVTVVAEQSAIAALAAEVVGEHTGLAVWMEEERSFLLLFRKGILVLQRMLECRSELLPAAMKRMLEDGAELLSGEPAEAVYFLGDSADETLCSRVEAELNVSVKEKDWEITEKSNAANVGAALSMVGFLTREEEEEKRNRKKRERIRLYPLVAVFLSLLVLTPPLLEYFSLASEVLEWKNRLLLAEKECPDEMGYREVLDWRSTTEEAEQITEPGRLQLMTFLRELGQKCPESFCLESFSYAEGEVIFSASAVGKQPVAELLWGMERMNGVSEVRLEMLSSDWEEETERVQFSVYCLLAGGKEEP